MRIILLALSLISVISLSVMMWKGITKDYDVENEAGKDSKTKDRKDI